MLSKVDDAMSWPCRVSSATVMVETSDESFNIMMMVLPKGGMAMRIAWGGFVAMTRDHYPHLN